jgi:excisionase family DNA binding protein
MESGERIAPVCAGRSEATRTEGGLERQTLTVEEAGQILGLGRCSAYEAVKVGDIPSLRIGRRLIVPRAALERMLAGGIAA